MKTIETIKYEELGRDNKSMKSLVETIKVWRVR